MYKNVKVRNDGLKDARMRLSDMMVLLWLYFNAIIEFTKIMFPSTTMNPDVEYF